jgi:hypothetical protein
LLWRFQTKILLARVAQHFLGPCDTSRKQEKEEEETGISHSFSDANPYDLMTSHEAPFHKDSIISQNCHLGDQAFKGDIHPNHSID